MKKAANLFYAISAVVVFSLCYRSTNPSGPKSSSMTTLSIAPVKMSPGYNSRSSLNQAMSDGCDTLLDKTDAAKADNYFVVTYNTDDKGVLKSTAITESNFGSDNFDRCLENVMKSYGYVAPAVEPNGEVKERLEYTSTRVVKTDSLAH